MDTVLKLEGVAKKFCRRLRYSLLYGSIDVARGMLNLKASTAFLRPGEFWAVQEVSLELKKGESLGLVGANGSGKSTLLRLINGIFPPDKGRIEVRGKVGALIAAGAGFHPLMTGRENIYLNGAILGISKKEINKAFDSIVDFADIGEFLDAPVKTYSSGMYVRLGFAIAIHCQPDLLLIDEILAVGDLSFQKKCIKEMTRLLDLGTSMIFVSHNPYLVERLSNRVGIMKAGRIEELGTAIDVIPAYFQQMNTTPANGNKNTSALPAHIRQGTGEVRVTSVDILDKHGDAVSVIESGEPVTVRVHYDIFQEPLSPNIAVFILNAEDIVVVCLEATKVRRGLIGSKSGFVDCRIHSLPLMPGSYSIQIRIAANDLVDFVDCPAKFTVTCPPDNLLSTGNKGILSVQAEWRNGDEIIA
jgi:lipopolysaccharide transport system ATP-binding protein